MQNHKVLYMNLLTRGKPNKYLINIDEQAEETFFQLAKHMANHESVAEQLIAYKQLE